MLVNEGGKVLQTFNEEDDGNSRIGVYPKKEGEDSQLFELLYVDEMPA